MIAEPELMPVAERLKWWQRHSPLTNKDKATIIERIVVNDERMKDLAREYGVSYDIVKRILELYFKKPEISFNMPCKIVLTFESKV